MKPLLDRILEHSAPAVRAASVLPAWARRVLLYSSSCLVIYWGFSYYITLSETTSVEPPVETLTFHAGELGGNNLLNGLIDSGSSRQEAAAILKALKPAGGAGRDNRGDEYRIVRSTAGVFQHLTLTRGKTRVIVTPEENGTFKATTSKVPMQFRTFRRSGTIKGSLWPSMAVNGIPDEVIVEYADNVFPFTVDFLTETRDGDRYSVVWNERRTPDGRIWGRDIVAAVYDGRVSGKQVGVLFEDAYFDDKGNALERVFLRAPLNFRRISSSFSNGRYHPILKRTRKHQGTDYAAARGTPVVSIGEGRVTEAGYHGGFGKRIEIRHNSIYSSLYGHLDRYAKGISPGAHVRQGQVIGYVGSTGLATGPHLHFQFSKNGNWINFQSLKLPQAKSVPPAKLEQFKAVLDAQLAQLAESSPTEGSETAR